MPVYNADLHIHSPYSIAVSKNITLESLGHTASLKGLHILGTGDITQPQWRAYLKEHLEKSNLGGGIGYAYKSISYILQTELEDNQSIHYVVFLPDFAAVDALVERLRPHVKDIDGRWAGRPHVHLSPAELIEEVDAVNGLLGPAHAFTPFKSIFRAKRFCSLKEAFGSAAKKVAFLELGLSADTALADRIHSLADISFLSNSDAHSEGLDALGREFNRLEIETPSFDELRLALLRRQGRKVVLNAGLDPRLGKYYIAYCGKCRRRVDHQVAMSPPPAKSQTPEGLSKALFGFPAPQVDGDFIRYPFQSPSREQAFLRQIEQGKVPCPACARELPAASGKRRAIPKLELGVSERINAIADSAAPQSPPHRPPYIHLVPLIELLARQYRIKTLTSKTLSSHYSRIIHEFGPEYHVMVDMPTEQFKGTPYEGIGEAIGALRNESLAITPGGGGNFGMLEWD